MYVRGNPVRLHDPSGNAGALPECTDQIDYNLPNQDVKALPDNPTLGGMRGNASGSFSEAIENTAGASADDLGHGSSSSFGKSSASGIEPKWRQELNKSKRSLTLRDVYGNGKIPKKGDKPTDLTHLIGTDKYYFARKLDFELRHPGKEAPDYYEDYGSLYLHKFKYDTRESLSPQGQKWLDRTLVNLQKAIEKEVSNSKNTVEENPEKFREFAFGTHPDAYIDAGLFSLPIQDLKDIGSTPNIEDLIGLNGLKQIFTVGERCVTDGFLDNCTMPILKSTVQPYWRTIKQWLQE